MVSTKAKRQCGQFSLTKILTEMKKKFDANALAFLEQAHSLLQIMSHCFLPSNASCWIQTLKLGITSQ
jgi:hypothetical protein